METNFKSIPSSCVRSVEHGQRYCDHNSNQNNPTINNIRIGTWPIGFGRIRYFFCRIRYVVAGNGRSVRKCSWSRIQESIPKAYVGAMGRLTLAPTEARGAAKEPQPGNELIRRNCERRPLEALRYYKRTSSMLRNPRRCWGSRGRESSEETEEELRGIMCELELRP